jgi:hypothetical protein
MDASSTAPEASPQAQSLPDRPGVVRYPPDASQCASELLSMVAYLTARDGPLQQAPAAGAPPVAPPHERLLRKAAERLEVIDAYMRARVAFLVSGRDRGYYAPQAELDLAGATLDAARTAATVVDALLGGRLPSRHEFDAMGVTALRVTPALEALNEAEAPPGP